MEHWVLVQKISNRDNGTHMKAGTQGCSLLPAVKDVQSKYTNMTELNKL